MIHHHPESWVSLKNILKISPEELEGEEWVEWEAADCSGVLQTSEGGGEKCGFAEDEVLADTFNLPLLRLRRGGAR